MESPSVSPILESLASAGRDFESNKVGSREALIDLLRALIAEIEIPSEFIQRSFWAEVSNEHDANYISHAIPANPV